MENLTRESILQAIRKIDEKPQLIKGRESFMYDLVFEGYPSEQIHVKNYWAKVSQDY